jgi:hypothetical protein
MRSRGYARSRTSFYHHGPDGWGVVNLQLSQFGSRQKVVFYINVAVALDRLLARDGLDAAHRPPESKCHWRSRIEQLTNAPSQWEVTDGTDMERLAHDLIELLDRAAIPWIEERQTEAGFLKALTRAPAGAVIRPASPVIGSFLGLPEHEAMAGS